MLAPWHSFVDLIEWSLTWLADWSGNGGLAIILFTIIVKTILLPLTVKSVRSTAAMQELQPKIKELQKKYGKDRQRISQETMKLYAEHGVNPAAGCLPMLAQMPVFIGLFWAIRDLSGNNGGHFSDGFLWISNLSQADSVSLVFVSIAPLAILAGVFQFAQMRMMRPAGQEKSSDPQQAMMQSMMNFMPLLVVIFGWTFPAGIVLYWAIQSLYSVIQQWFITGWGGLKDWFPWLPELPDHRRLGYKKPEERKVVVSGSGEAEMGGIMGWMQKQTRQFEEKQRERMNAQQPEQQESEPEESEQEEKEPATTGKNSRKRNRKKAKKPAATSGQAKAETETDHTETDAEEEIEEGVTVLSASGGQAKRRGKRKRK